MDKNLKLLQSNIEKEFAEFRDEIITGTTRDLFDRAQEIIIKTNLAAEILSGFETLIDYGGAHTSISAIVQTLITRMQDPEEENILHSLYEDFIIYMPVLFDEELSSEFFLEYYSDEQEM